MSKIKAYQPTDPSGPLKKRRPKDKLCPKCQWMHSCPDAKIHQREFCSDYELDTINTDRQQLRQLGG